MNHSKSTVIAEKAVAPPVVGVSVAPVEESDRQFGLSKASKEQKQGLDSSPKEMQSRQHGSTRSRIKVKKTQSYQLSTNNTYHFHSETLSFINRFTCKAWRLAELWI